MKLAAWTFGVLTLAATLAAADPTPAERAIERANSGIQRSPRLAASRNELALALVRRARETGDSSYLGQAERAVDQALEIENDNFDALRVRVMILLARHENTAALDLATRLNKKIPDDVLTYGLMADALTSLGRYDEAEKQTQWMLDLRPGNLGAYIRGAALREVWKDYKGALDWYSLAFRLTSASETEERAWLSVQISRVQLKAGQPEAAGRSAAKALELFPGYHLALAELEEIRKAAREQRPATAPTGA